MKMVVAQMYNCIRMEFRKCFHSHNFYHFNGNLRSSRIEQRILLLPGIFEYT